ncbi:MAG TPA: DUF4185 domain-containing protein [Bryobacteraceae bacterium]|jgi:hypothetical protein
MMRAWSLAAVLLLAVVSLPGAPASVSSDLFPYRQHWLGGDAAYSVPLNSTTTVWVFGDTFVGDRRTTGDMIHNSLGIRKCQRSCGVTYWWSGMHGGHPDAFFRTKESNYFWPLDGFVSNGVLYVFLEQMRATPEGGAFGFDYQSIKLAVISNPTDAPEQWKISYHSVSEGNQVVPGIAAALADEGGTKYLYVFTLFHRSANHPFVGLLRTRVDRLTSTDLRHTWQYMSGPRQWSSWMPSTSPQNALELLSGNITEMSVNYHPELKMWVAVYPTPGGSFRTASYSQAALVSGPWGQPHRFFTYPEMRKDDPRHTPNVFCYAAKEHPELEENAQMAITYACNSFREPEILNDLRLYRPELVITAMPGSPRPVLTNH